jgi:hypothetical protein
MLIDLSYQRDVDEQIAGKPVECGSCLSLDTVKHVGGLYGKIPSSVWACHCQYPMMHFHVNMPPPPEVPRFSGIAGILESSSCAVSSDNDCAGCATSQAHVESQTPFNCMALQRCQLLQSSAWVCIACKHGGLRNWACHPTRAVRQDLHCGSSPGRQIHSLFLVRAYTMHQTTD